MYTTQQKRSVVAPLRLTNQRRKHHILRTIIGPSLNRNNTAISLGAADSTVE